MARHGNSHNSQRDLQPRRRSAGMQVLGVVGELFLTLAAICALYIAWQLWWTGVESERAQLEQRETVSWSDPAAAGTTAQIAQPQQGDPPKQPEASAEGNLVAQLYIPRFGLNWQRNVVEGVGSEQLALHGLGHYPTSQMAGQVGNYAVAGHRSGYGEPLGNVNLLQEGDPIIVRTQDYWYVYHYTNNKITLPNDVGVVDPDPSNDGAQKSESGRYITLTTCEPRYSTATHRWISWGSFDYWAKVSDGVPKELATTDSAGQVKFAAVESPSVFARVGSLQSVVMWLLVAYAVIYLASLVAWRYPVLRQIRDGERLRPDASLYGWLLRHQPGPLPIRLILLALLVVAGSAALFEWVFPWAAANIPVLQMMSNYVAVQ